eukprot:1090211-Pleurochrysis_carterae.AAC.1
MHQSASVALSRQPFEIHSKSGNSSESRKIAHLIRSPPVRPLPLERNCILCLSTFVWASKYVSMA